MKQFLRCGLAVVLVAAMLVGAIPIQAQDAPDGSKPQVYLPAITGRAPGEFSGRVSDEVIWGLPGRILKEYSGEPLAAGPDAVEAASVPTVVDLSIYGEVIGDIYYVTIEALNTSYDYCAQDVMATVRVTKSGGGYMDITATELFDTLPPRQKAPLKGSVAISTLGAQPTGASVVSITASECDAGLTYRYVTVSGSATNVTTPVDGTKFTGTVLNDAGFNADYGNVVASVYLTGTNVLIAAVQSTMGLSSGNSSTWTVYDPVSKWQGYPIKYVAQMVTETTPNSWWNWSSGTTIKRTAGYNPGGSSSTGKISLMSAYGEQTPYVYSDYGGSYSVSALLRNNSTVAAACYVTMNVRIYHVDNSYQTITGGLFTEGLPPGAILPAKAVIPANQITGGLSNAVGYAITGGGAAECEDGQSFGLLATSNTSKTLQGNGDIAYAGTVTNNTPKPTSNLTGAYAALNSNGSIRYAGTINPEGDGEEAGLLDAYTSKNFSGLAQVRVSPTLNTYNTSYYLEATWYGDPPSGSSPYTWGYSVPNGISVLSSWGQLYYVGSTGYYVVTALVQNNTNFYVCDVTMNAYFILDDGNFTRWNIPSSYLGHSLLKCLPPGGSGAVNSTIPKSQVPTVGVRDHRILDGTYTPATNAVATLAPANTAVTLVSTGGYYTATVTNNTPYTYTQVYAEADVFKYPNTGIYYAQPLTSTDTLFTPGETVTWTGRSYVLGVTGNNPTAWRAQALP